jgi:hypothetical protein
MIVPGRDLECQIPVRGRVEPINSGADEGHGIARSLQCATMSGCIYPQGKTAGDGQLSLGKGRGEALGVRDPLWRRVAATDHGQGSRIEQIETAANVEQRRWVGDLQQCLGIFRVGQTQQVLTGLL